MKKLVLVVDSEYYQTISCECRLWILDMREVTTRRGQFNPDFNRLYRGPRSRWGNMAHTITAIPELVSETIATLNAV